jgi:hypothetical protein
VRAKAIMRSAFVALVSLMFSEKDVDVVSARTLIALAFESNDDMVGLCEAL